MRWVVLVLIMGLLVFGCTGQTEPTTGGTTTTTGGATSGGSQVLDITGKKMAELISLNLPVECDMSMKTEGETGPVTIDVKLFMKGKSFREDMVMQGKSLTVIMKDKILYSSNPQKGEAALGEFGACDWLMFDLNSEFFKGNQEDLSGGFDPAQLDIDAKISYTCKQASFGDEKFSVSGKTCDMAVFYQQIAAGS